MTDYLTYWQYAVYQIALHPALAWILAAAVLPIAVIALIRSLKPWTSHIHGREILTPNEREFFYRLTRALPHYHVFPQVALSALIAVDSRLSNKRRFAIRRRFGWKYADFVICQRGSLIVRALVELDDRTHDPRADRKRDIMLGAAGHRTIRFQSKHKPTEAEIAALFRSVVP